MTADWIVGNPPSARFPIYTRANVGEVFPEPVAPLTFTLAFWEVTELGFREAYVRTGAFTDDEFSPDAYEFTGTFGGYTYLNASLFRILGERMPGLSAEAMDAQWFGNQPGIPPYEPEPWHHRPELTERCQRTIEWILTATSLPEVDEMKAAADRMRAERPDLEAMSNRDHWRRTREVIGSYRPYFAQHLFISFCGSIPLGIINQTCEALGRPEAALSLIAGIGDVDSAAPSHALWRLGRMVAASPALTKLFDGGVDGVLDDLGDAGEDGRRFAEAFAEFLFHYGCRGPNEWEASIDSWETDPTLALAAVDRMRLSPDDADPALRNRQRAAERERLAAELIPLLDGQPEAQGQFAAALRAAPLFMAARERTKTNAIKVVNELRMGTFTMGRRLTAEGHLDAWGDAAMLKADEVDDFLSDPGSMASEIRRRRRHWRELAALQEPFVVVGEPPPVDTWPPRREVAVDRLGPGESLAGVPGCPGVARGRARVVLDSHDPSALGPGDILVAPHTDPSWTPLFVPAAGVVVDVGAPLSHAIIVSRELGIPCVVSATGATRAIPDGALVEVDGTRGTVTVLET